MGKKLWIYLNPIDRITLFYLLFTLIFIVIAWNGLENKWFPVVLRLAVVCSIFSMGYYQISFSGKILKFVRYAYPLVLIIYLYPETDLFNNILFEDQDLFFYRAEEQLFGFQPSLIFHDRFPQLWINEMMSFGYFSYYLIIFLSCLILYLKDTDQFYRITFIVISSFYIYYLIFIILPVAGPQYFIPPPDNEVPQAYFFSRLIKLVQECGERPTGAFPSSHVGVIVIILWYTYIYLKKWFVIFFPVSIVLILSTVYLKAHYLIDVLAAFVTLPLFILAGNRLFRILKE